MRDKKKKLKDAISRNKPICIRLFLVEPKTKTMLLTKGQIHKIERAQLLGKDRISIKVGANIVDRDCKNRSPFFHFLIF